MESSTHIHFSITPALIRLTGWGNKDCLRLGKNKNEGCHNLLGQYFILEASSRKILISVRQKRNLHVLEHCISACLICASLGIMRPP